MSWQWLGWALLTALLAVLLFTAAAHRSYAPSVVGEATYLMQAESLVRDLDLTYTRADYDRQLLRWAGDPAELALASGSDGRRIVFDRPFPYALWLAPFVALWPRAGAAVANGVLLALAALLVAGFLQRRLGAWAPWWLVVLVFGSALFAFVLPATGEVFLLAVTVAGFAVLVPSRPGDGTPQPGVRLGAPRGGYFAGALLAIPLATDWLYGLLLAAAWWMPSVAGRAAVRRALVAGAVAMLAAIVVVHWLAGGGWWTAANGFLFTATTGFPLVDFPAAEWPSAVRYLEGHVSTFPWDAELRLWSIVDLVFGRAIGLMPYFAPLLLLVASGSLRGFRRPIVVAAFAWPAAVVVLRPFEVAGAEGFANPGFLPFYGALWLLPDPRRRPVRLAAGVAATALVATLFLSSLWRHPWIAWDDRGPGHETSAARRLLPYETSQRWCPAGAVVDDELTVAAVGGDAWVEARHRRVVVEGGFAELVIGSGRPLRALRVDFEGPVPEHLRLRGARMEAAEESPSPGTSSILVPAGPRRRHASDWSSRRSYRYVVALEWPPSAGPAALRLRNGDGE